MKRPLRTVSEVKRLRNRPFRKWDGYKPITVLCNGNSPMGVGGGHYVESTGYLNKYTDLTRCGCGFGRVAMGIRAGRTG